MKIKTINMGWKPMKDNSRRLKEGMAKMREALERDYLDSLKRPSGLPEDWGSRLIKSN